MSLLLLLRNHEATTTPEPPVVTPRGGAPRPPVRIRRHLTGTLTIHVELSATTSVVFDVLADDDEIIAF